jgi:hypothetical protein
MFCRGAARAAVCLLRATPTTQTTPTRATPTTKRLMAMTPSPPPPPASFFATKVEAGDMLLLGLLFGAGGAWLHHKTTQRVDHLARVAKQLKEDTNRLDRSRYQCNERMRRVEVRTIKMEKAVAENTEAVSLYHEAWQLMTHSLDKKRDNDNNSEA